LLLQLAHDGMSVEMCKCYMKVTINIQSKTFHITTITHEQSGIRTDKKQPPPPSVAIMMRRVGFEPTRFPTAEYAV
jgi:hypothetical protein